MNQKGNSLIYVLVGIIILIVIFLGYSIFSPLFYGLQYDPILIIPTPSPIVASPTITPITQNFQKRQFDLMQPFFQTEDYPAEILNIPDSNLVGIKCSPIYNSDYQGGFVYNEMNKTLTLTDPRFLNLVKMVIKDPNSHIDAGRYCDTEDNRTIFEYEVWGGGGGGNNVANFGIVLNDNFNIITTISNDGIPYFSCQNPLELTTNNVLYYGCGGGDGGGAGASIYKIDLTKKLSKLLIKCTSQADNTAPQGYTLTCK